MSTNPMWCCMAKTETYVDGAMNEKHKLVMVSAERSDAEKHDAYKVELRDPADKQSLTERFRDLF